MWEFHLQLWFLKQFSEMWLLNVVAAICAYLAANESDSHLSQSLAKMTSVSLIYGLFTDAHFTQVKKLNLSKAT